MIKTSGEEGKLRVKKAVVIWQKLGRNKFVGRCHEWPLGTQRSRGVEAECVDHGMVSKTEARSIAKSIGARFEEV